jgi:hypothetical protein
MPGIMTSNCLLECIGAAEATRKPPQTHGLCTANLQSLVRIKLETRLSPWI